jgi:ketosteroid isomerase-like protein
VSQENVEIARASFDAIGRWDIDALLELYDPEITFLPLTGTRVESGGYVGHDGVRAYFAEVAEIWSQLHPRADDVRTTGDHVVVLGGCAVRGKGSGVESDDPMAWVLTVSGGKIKSHRGYRTREEALAAVGMSE